MKATIQNEGWEAEVNESKIKLSHSKRAGNSIETIHCVDNDFLFLYNLVNALAQLHPEWLQ